MSLQILIGGVDYTSYVDFNSVKIDNNIAVTSDTAQFNIKITNKEMPRPKGGSELIVLNGTNREFGGVHISPEEDEIAAGVMLYQCKSRDYGYWADRRLIVEDIMPDYAGNMIKSVVSSFSSGFTTNNVQTGPLAPYQKVDYVPLTKFVKKLADLFSFGWYIDYYKDFHFFAYETFVSPLPNNLLNIDDPTNALYFGNLTLTEDVSQVRTRVYLKGHKVGARYTVTDTFVADGQQTSFPLRYEPIHDLGKGMVITVAGTNYPAKRDIVDGLPNATASDGNAYVNFDTPQARFNVAPASGSVVSVTYYPRLPEALAVSDVQSQKIMAARDQQDGIYEFAINDPGLSWDDASIAQARGQLEINKYGRPHYSGQFTSFLQGWRAGQFFYFYSKRRMDGDLNGFKMFVTKVSKTLVNHPKNGTPTFQYTVSIADTPYVY